jgi:Domain of unknown function (DUF4372)/Transposase DDE domain
MHSGRLVFTQFLQILSRWNFAQCVHRYQGNRRVRRFSCWDQFLVMIFAQLTSRESLRDIETCLRAVPEKLYQAGLRGSVARSTLAEANEQRDWRIWADLAASLIAEARPLYASEPLGMNLQATAYAFDTTTVDLCLTLFPWARFRRRKSAVRMHTLLDLRGNIPCFMHITAGSVHELQALDHVVLEAGAYYIMDRGFVDFARLYRFTREQAFFITRARTHMDYRVIESRPVDLGTGLRADQTIRFRVYRSRRRYPAPLRRVSLRDPDTGRHYVFLTNNFTLAASTICRLYRRRWEVELFFKWIKQYLRIKCFLGTSPNAVKTQIWIALCLYVLVALLRKHLRLQQSMGEIMQILSVTLFEKTPILQVFSQEESKMSRTENHKPLPLLDI